MVITFTLFSTCRVMLGRSSDEVGGGLMVDRAKVGRRRSNIFESQFRRLMKGRLRDVYATYVVLLWWRLVGCVIERNMSMNLKPTMENLDHNNLLFVLCYL